VNGQAGRASAWASRASCSTSTPSTAAHWKAEGYLRRDAREKERRKYGLKKARKAPQYSKR
jgi:small subunit ribosomal protein S9